MDASLFLKAQAAQAAAAHAVGTSLAPKRGAASNLRSTTGPTAAATPVRTTSKTAAAADTGSTTGTSSSGASATASGATITSSDFLTLLVSELQNQDPTQPTDPNEYISQLVEVNSLEQLISINSGIGSLDTAAGATASGSTGSAVPAGSAIPASGAVSAGSAVPSIAAAPAQHTRTSAGAV